jgi:hypothetical protein
MKSEKLTESRIIGHSTTSKSIDWSNWRCVDCDYDTSPINPLEKTRGYKNYYMVNNDLWAKFGVGRKMLCIPCLEKRIGREVTKQDFTDCMLNRDNKYVTSL